VLSPKCDSDSFCEDSLECSSPCNLWNIRKCDDDKPLCSYISKCVDMENLPECYKNSDRERNYVTKYSFETEESDVGYKYFNIPDDDVNYDVSPGDIFGFKSDGSSSLWYRNASASEVENGFEDTSNGEGLGVLHYLQAILGEPANVSLVYTYNKIGNYSVSVSLTDLSSEYSEVTYLPVQIPVSDVYLEINQVNIIVGKEVSACMKANGSNLDLYWDYFGKEEQEKFDGPVPKEGIFKNITCSSSGDYVLNVNISNLWNSESGSVEFHCFESIGRDWSFNSDSPKSTPPGEVVFNLKFDGSKFPTSVSYVIYFGDGSGNDATEITSENDEWKTSFSHIYENDGNFTAVVNISNPVDFEVFELTIQIYVKMSNLSVTPFFVMRGSYPDDKSEIKGKNKTDAPKDATLYFENNITGHVTSYRMQFSDGSYDEDSSDNIISHSFPETGEWTITFTAWNSEVDEYSNEVKLLVRILNDVSDVVFNASTTDTEVDETVEFEIKVHELDDYTCLMFDGGDDSRFLGFGNKDVCTLYYDEGQFKFVKKASGSTSRKKRGASKAEWKDDDIIRGHQSSGSLENFASPQKMWYFCILYSYAFGGDFPATVDVFNSVSRLKKNLTISVSDGDYKTPLIWIDKNSSDIENPIECQRGYDCRYETTAVFRNNESYLASHRWTAYSIDSSGKEEEIDITDLKTHNCSAIRIVKRFLPIGLYKLKYTLTVYGK
ncbi:UNVERIFIED_CONTAM: hypothetical protein NCL1_22857, partial [Trichonephila clavipes]